MEINFRFFSMRQSDSSEHRINLYCLFAVILLSTMLMALTLNKMVPLSEGWYSTYADLILAGKTPYKDFELVFPPFYTYLMTGFSAAFGGSLISYRILGAIVFVATAIIEYYILRQLFSPLVSAIGAVISFFMMYSDVIFISHDYINFYNFMNLVSFYFVTRFLIKLLRKEDVCASRYFMLIGIMLGTALLIRQSTGLMVLVFMLLFFIVLKIVKPAIGYRYRDGTCLALGASIPVAVVSVSLMGVGAFDAYVHMTMFSGVKGSFLNILFGWLGGIVTSYGAVLAGMAIVVILWSLITKFNYSWANDDESKQSRIQLSLVTIVVLVFMIAILFSYVLAKSLFRSWFLDAYVTFIFLFVLINFLILFVKIIHRCRKKIEIEDSDILCILFFGFFFMLCWGAGMSVNITPRHISFCFGFVSAFILVKTSSLIESTDRVPFRNKHNLAKLAVVGIAFLFVITCVSAKTIHTYTWWGIETESYDEAKYYTDLDYLEGIRVTSSEKVLFEDFVEIVDGNLGDGEMYCYSRIPIFYTLANCMPKVFVPVPWFDVASDESVLRDLDYLQANNPKIIVFEDHGEWTMWNQENYYRDGHNSGQRAIYNWLIDCRDDPTNGYDRIYKYDVQGTHLYIMIHT